MRITVIPARELGPAELARWSELQRANPCLASPFLRPEFTQSVATVRPAVEVAILEENERIVGFFPFERGRWNIGCPVGRRVCDLHGLIAAPNLDLRAEELMRGCRLAGWWFHDVPVEQTTFAPHHHAVGESWRMNIEGGLDAYRQRIQSQSVVEKLRVARKLARERGPLRFEFRTTDAAGFQKLLDWKTAQYRRTKVPNVLGYRWVVELLDRVRFLQSEGFAGVLSALYAGDHLAAVHLGMRSGNLLHTWFPTYDVALGKYSPGILLMLEYVRMAPEQGLAWIDLGKGDQPYKRSLATDTILLAEGCVCCEPVSRLLHQTWPRTRAWLKSSPLQRPTRLLGRYTRSLRGWLAFR